MSMFACKVSVVVFNAATALASVKYLFVPSEICDVVVGMFTVAAPVFGL